MGHTAEGSMGDMMMCGVSSVRRTHSPWPLGALGGRMYCQRSSSVPGTAECEDPTAPLGEQASNGKGSPGSGVCRGHPAGSVCACPGTGPRLTLGRNLASGEGPRLCSGTLTLTQALDCLDAGVRFHVLWKSQGPWALTKCCAPQKALWDAGYMDPAWW